MTAALELTWTKHDDPVLQHDLRSSRGHLKLPCKQENWQIVYKGVLMISVTDLALSDQKTLKSWNNSVYFQV